MSYLQLLEALYQEGFIEKREGPTGTEWRITEKGMNATEADVKRIEETLGFCVACRVGDHRACKNERCTCKHLPKLLGNPDGLGLWKNRFRIVEETSLSPGGDSAE